MNLHSDFGKIKDVLDSDGISSISFIENNLSGRYSNMNGGQDYSNGSVDAFEKNLHDIFKKAEEYKDRILNVQNRMEGGAINDTLRLMLDTTKIMKDTNKYPNLKQKDLMAISKMIVDSAKNKLNQTTTTEEVKELAKKLAKNPDEFIAAYKTKKSTSSSGNKSNSRGNYRSSRNNDRDYGDDDDDWEGWQNNQDGGKSNNYMRDNTWNTNMPNSANSMWNYNNKSGSNNMWNNSQIMGGEDNWNNTNLVIFVFIFLSFVTIIEIK